jgi:hypothetical protein
MSVRDQDLDGRNARLLERSLVCGDGPHFRVIRPTVVRLVNPESRRRPVHRRVLVA